MVTMALKKKNHPIPLFKKGRIVKLNFSRKNAFVFNFKISKKNLNNSIFKIPFNTNATKFHDITSWEK